MNRKVFIIVQLQMLLSASIPTLSLHDICPILASRTHKLSKHPQACIGINGMETDKDQQPQINKSQEEDNKQNDTFDGDGDPASAQIGRQISFEEAGMVTLYSSRKGNSRQFHQSGYQSYDAQSSHTSIDDEQPSFASPGTRPSERNRIRNRVESAIGSPGREVQQLSPQRSLLSSLDQH